jgi:hypothetical protein
MTDKEALKLALEALERSVATCFDRYAHEQVMSRPEHFVNQAITAIKEALAQPDAFERGRQEGMKQERALWTLTKLGQEIEAQRPWVGLTEVDVLAESKHWRNPEDFLNGVYWAETELKEKNT